ncbi:MAG: DUF938 domain-containing protein [Rhodospirillaceae bacterium]|jgi:SAM-dependent methyltransferase|nr:DUF938 domain-containing protein [Rhodospirillaceae bacterium]MBT6119630.1 DUF938 domain-containing protein [Rhodospirillaceae bacterium]
MTQAPRLFAPATARNRGPILDVLRRVLPASGSVLELAAGTGDHAAFFAESLPGLDWRPTEADPHLLPEIEARRRAAGLANLREAALLAIDGPDWRAPDTPLAAIVAINLLHIAPWPVAEHLFAGAGRALAENGILFLYGPYRRDGAHTAPSNAQFDAMLRRHDPAWGVRDLDAVARLGEAHGLALDETVAMPANNLSLIFRRA